MPRSLFLETLNDQALDTLAREAVVFMAPGMIIQLRVLGGAMGRVAAGATAFAHRDAQVMIVVAHAAPRSANTASLHTSMEQIWQGIRPYRAGVYVNFLAEEGDTKFFIPSSSHALIARPRLTELLSRASLQHSLTLVSAPAGFGKTTLLASWLHSVQAEHLCTAWISLEEEDNDPQRFWSAVLTALDRQQPGPYAPLLTYLQAQETPPLLHLVKMLVNTLSESGQQVLLVLDDYHLITEQAVHTSLSSLVEFLPPHVHLLLATRTDPPLPLSRLRGRSQMLEVRTDQLRCTPEEAVSFLQTVMDIVLSSEQAQEVTARTEGWLVGLQMLGLSLQGRTNPDTLLEAFSGYAV